jgi:hypothetical protein
MLKLRPQRCFPLFRDTKLLSFGDEEDQDSGVIAGGKKKNMARPDCEEDISIFNSASRQLMPSNSQSSILLRPQAARGRYRLMSIFHHLCVI